MVQRCTFPQHYLRSTIDTKVLTKTVQNYLHAVGLYARRPMVHVMLTSNHRGTHSEWGTERKNIKKNEWIKIIFSYESRFLFILTTGVFSSGKEVALETILH